MKLFTAIFFTLSALLFLGMLRNILGLKRPGIYPPKQLLKKRSLALAAGGGICLFAASILFFFS